MSNRTADNEGLTMNGMTRAAYGRLAVLALAATILLPLRAGETAPADRKAEEQKLIAALQGADGFAKDDACRRLRVIGTKDAVPALAALLADENLYDVARYGLEGIPDPAADDAFRAALGKVKGKQLAAAARSVGTRRDTKAVDELAKLLGDADANVACAAGIALGQLGGPAATKALEEAMSKAPPAARAGIGEGILTILDALLADGKREDAAALADRVRAADMPAHIRSAAFRAAVLGRGAAGVALITEQLKAADREMTKAALRVAREIPGADATKALAGELGKLPTDQRILLVQALGDRRDSAALPAIVAEIKGGDKAVRPVALRVLGQLADATAVPLLLAAAGDADATIARAAKATLAGLPGKEVDAAVLAAMNDGNPATRRLAIEAVGERRIAGAGQALLKATEDASADTRVAAMKSLGEAGTTADLDAILGLLVKRKENTEVQACESAVSAVIARTSDKQACADKMLALYPAAEPPAKCAMLRAMRATPVPKALETIRAGTKDGNNEIKETAIRALCEWQGAEAADELLAMAKGSANQTHKILALRGYLRIIRDDKQLATEKKLAMCKEAAALVTRDDQKKDLLGALSAVPSAEALAMVVPYFEGAAKNEAASAACTIGEETAKSHPAETAAAMKKVLEATQNKGIQKKAHEILGRAQQKPGKK